MRPLKTESFFWLVTAGEVRDSMQEKDSMSHCWLLDRDALWQSSRWPPEAIGGPCKQQGKGEFSHITARKWNFLTIRMCLETNFFPRAFREISPSNILIPALWYSLWYTLSREPCYIMLDFWPTTTELIDQCGFKL